MTVSLSKTPLYFCLGLALGVSSGCGSSADATGSLESESVSEIGGSVIGGAVSLSSNADSSSLFGDKTAVLSESALKADSTRNTCPSLLRATCSGTKISLTYSGCAAITGSGETWTGTEDYSFTSGTCTNTPEGNAVTFARTFPTSMVQTNSSGRTITSETNKSSGWETVNAGGGTTFVIDPVAHTRSIQIDGLHMVATQNRNRGEHKSVVTIWDRTVSTSAPIVFDQARHIISSGSLTVQNNTQKLTAIIRVVTPLVFTSGICNPTSGVMTATFSGSLTGTETLTYTGNNQATLLDHLGKTSSITLSHCL